MKLSINQLRKVTNMLLDHLDELKTQDIEIPVEYYWDISGDERYNVYSKPNELDVGKISDDWNSLESILQNKYSPVFLNFVQLGNVLIGIGDSISEASSKTNEKSDKNN